MFPDDDLLTDEGQGFVLTALSSGEVTMFGQLLDSIVQEALALRKPMLIVRSFDLFFSSHNIQYKILAYTPNCSYFSISYLVNLGI